MSGFSCDVPALDQDTCPAGYLKFLAGGKTIFPASFLTCNPVSSSMVIKQMQPAVPCLCLANTSPATVSVAPSFIVVYWLAGLI